MIKSLTRVSLLALFSTNIFAAAAIAPPPASADWKGEIAPGAERPAGQAQASGFADQNGLILIPTPAQVGDIEEAIFHGIGAVSIAVSNDTTLIIEETLPLSGLQLTISTGRGSTGPFHTLSFDKVDRTGAEVEPFLSFVALLDEGGSASVEMTGSFVCSGSICDGPQDGKLSFSLEALALPE